MAAVWASLMAQLIKNLSAMQETLVQFLGQKDPLEKGTPVFLGFPCVSAGKESTGTEGDLGSVPGLGRSPGKGKGYSPQYSGLENSMYCLVYGVSKSWTRLSDFHFLFLSYSKYVLSPRTFALAAPSAWS